MSPENSGGDQPPTVPDYKLLRCIGQGSYGQVWLAQNVQGTFRAVKVVYRRTFQKRPDSGANASTLDREAETESYEREFRGVQEFEAVSGAHPGLLTILHVGRNDRAGYYYYVMALADDESGLGPVDPALYQARTLDSELRRRGRLTVEECVQIGISLAEALDHLHANGLIHRDIKPANILFVNGVAKLGDIGTITQIGREVSQVYTHGYCPPEGPGQPAADVFSLGKVLYRLNTGLRAEEFPALPPTVAQADKPRFTRLHQITLRACCDAPRRRYPSARALRDDLIAVLRRPHPIRSTMIKAALGAAALGLTAGLLLLGTRSNPKPKGPTAATDNLLGTYYPGQVRQAELTMVFIPPGTFVMGSPPTERARDEDETQHEVTISRGFWMGAYEVTQKEYQAVMGHDPSFFGLHPNWPVERIQWYDATNYCGQLTAQAAAAGRLPEGYVYRLPTEAEWEYACRAGTTTAFHHGPELRSGMENFDGTREYPPGGGDLLWCKNPSGISLNRTTAVGSFEPNAWGLYDMHGNVWEWCGDWYGSYEDGPVTDPVGPATGEHRVFRGGDWCDDARNSRSANRRGDYAKVRYYNIGLRVVLAPPLVFAR